LKLTLPPHSLCVLISYFATTLVPNFLFNGVPNRTSSTLGTGGKFTSIFFFPAARALEIADAACFETCSLNQPSYILSRWERKERRKESARSRYSVRDKVSV
jgi:hypothetical protein